MYSNDIRGGLDYAPVRYGKSRLRFRGPAPDRDAGYIACLGGTATFGRFLPEPWPQLLADATGRAVANFGQVNAGLDLVLQDPEVLARATEADLCVVQVMGAQNMSNRFYTVHPRRNDRFVRASDALCTLYPDVDFCQIAFTGALMSALFEASPDRFELVVREVQTAWIARMKLILGHLPRPSFLLWMSERPPPERARTTLIPPLIDPAFVSRDMLDALAERVDGLIEVVEPASERHTRGMVFSEFDATLAGSMMSTAAHERAALALVDAIRAATPEAP